MWSLHKRSKKRYISQMSINCSRNAVYSQRLKSCVKDVQYVCHSAGKHILDVVAVHWYCDQWTSETARTTHARLLVSAVPQFQTVIAIHSLLQGSPHCIIYQVQVWTVCWPHRRLDKGDFSLCRYLKVFGSVRRRAVLLQEPVLWIHLSCALLVNII